MTWMPWLIMAAPKAAAFSCTMTAGASAAPPIAGYGSNSLGFPMGSIDQEPIPGEELMFLMSGVINGIAFSGDLTGILAGKSIWIDNVEYPATWIYESTPDLTVVDEPESWPTFVENQQYFIEIK